MDLNFEVKVEYLYEQQRKFEFCSEIERYTQTYCESQVTSKKYLIEKMYQHCPVRKYNFHIQGAWYGTLIIPYILNNFMLCYNRMHLNDIDPSVARILKSYARQHTSEMDYSQEDMFENTWWHNFLGDHNILINTSCEHMQNIARLDDGGSSMVYALQSNNYHEHPEHTNCVDSTDELIFKAGLNKIYFAGEVQCNKFTRFTVIGEK